MDKVLYYSNLCEHSKKILTTITKQNLGKNVSFICIDNRSKDAEGKVFISLENGQKLMLPSVIQQVPALLLVKNNFQVIYGNDICNKLRENPPPPGPTGPPNNNKTGPPNNNNFEPSGFSFDGVGEIVSDTYSFLDTSSDDLETKGNGGLLQLHHYSNVDGSNCPITKQDSADTSYKPNKINDSEYSTFKSGREHV